jgi:hypothetical protein
VKLANGCLSGEKCQYDAITEQWMSAYLKRHFRNNTIPQTPKWVFCKKKNLLPLKVAFWKENSTHATENRK